jgi:hypothetical protein
MRFRTLQNARIIDAATATASAITTTIPGRNAGDNRLENGVRWRTGVPARQEFYSLRAVGPGAAIPSFRKRSRACSASFDFG